MQFNSIDFAIFLPIVFILYWFVVNKNLKLQNLLIVISSYVFYGWWDWRFLSLILFSTIVDYSVGLGLTKQCDKKKRKILLWTSIIVNLGFLGFFKYYNFFLDSFITAFTFFGFEINDNSLNIILPVGISFYTFQTLSYTIDVYKKKLKPTKDFIAFSAFVSFFPQLVAGPIERANNLLPQFYKKRTFDYNKSIDGLRQIIWGLFMKVVIADNLAEYVNLIFNNSDSYSGSTLILGAVFFAFQVYGDFSGYSNIAIGTARLFGINLMQNFAFPFFSRDIAEFWRRWHISLMVWFREYLYYPLGGSRGGVWMKIRNAFIIFLVCGFWHGPKWTFVAWGALNAFYFLPLLLLNKNRVNTNIVAEGKYFPSIKEFLNMSLTFGLFVFSLMVFRANDLEHAYELIGEIFSPSIIDSPSNWTSGYITILHLFLLVSFMIIEWINRGYQYGLQRLPSNSILRKSIYVILILTILFTGDYHSKQEFFYFQF